MTKLVFSDISYINNKQKEMLNDLFKYVCNNNKYYKQQILKLNVNTDEDIEFCKLPIITKQDVKDNIDVFFSDSTEERYCELTSGSTGVPLACYKTKSERLTASLAMWKERRRIDSAVNSYNFFSLYGPGVSRVMGNFFDFEKNNMIKCFNRMMHYSPRWIQGPVTAIERYAKLIENNDVIYNSSTIKFIEFSGEYVDQEKRRYIEDVMKCKTTSYYGLKETWCVAYECQYDKLHILDNLIYAEVFKTNFDDSDIGEIVITSLYNRFMPFIRYNTKDLGKIKYESCSCGKTTPTIKLVEGRSGDIIKGENDVFGTLIFKRVLNSVILSGHDAIESFRAEQVALNRFRLYIVKKQNYTEHTTKLLTGIIYKELGKKVEVDIKFVELIPSLPSGKSKIFQCLI